MLQRPGMVFLDNRLRILGGRGEQLKVYFRFLGANTSQPPGNLGNHRLWPTDKVLIETGKIYKAPIQLTPFAIIQPAVEYV